MKTPALLCRLIVGLAAAAGAADDGLAQARSDGTLSGIVSNRLAEGVYQFTASFDGYVSGTNSVAVIGSDGALVFDTFTRPSEARELLRMIRRITPLPVRYVVNSHWHPDHWSGNEVFADAFPGVEIIATARTAEYMRNVAPAWATTFGNHRLRMEKARAARTAPLDADRDAEERLQIDFYREAATVRRTYPTRTYQGELVLRLGDRDVRLSTTQGDASDSTMIHLPRELLLRDKTYVALSIELLETIRRQVQVALRSGAVAPDDVVTALSLGALRERFAKLAPGAAEEFDAYAPEIARKFYQELRDGMISKR